MCKFIRSLIYVISKFTKHFKNAIKSASFGIHIDLIWWIQNINFMIDIDLNIKRIFKKEIELRVRHLIMSRINVHVSVCIICNNLYIL